MNLEAPKAEIKSATRVSGGPATPRKGPPKFKQRQTRQFKSKPPKKGIQGFGDDIPGMEGLGTGEFSSDLKVHRVSLCLFGPSQPLASHVLFFCRHHRHLPLGGLQSPGAARAGPVRHHLSPCGLKAPASGSISQRRTGPDKRPRRTGTNTHKQKREKDSITKKQLSVV
uniref:Retinal rod rhodopsin-sensitive cGMP 3',5'-cyclic phosphodiesterase subunit gamma n=1 Tax=Scophthalmus maximus TaxID=52904 RepID=A0A8D3D1Y9_SCOMX